MEATPQPLEGLRGPVGSRVFSIIQDEEKGQIMVSWSKKREKSDHPGGEEWINHAGREKSKAYEGSRGGFELDSYI